MDDVTLAHKPRLFEVAAQLKRSAHAALGLAANCAHCAVIPVAGQRAHMITFWALKITSYVVTTGAESAVHDRLVFCCDKGVYSPQVPLIRLGESEMERLVRG